MRVVLFSFCLIIISISWVSDRRTISGQYKGGFGGSILLRADSTFVYEWRFDMMYSWNRGIWKTVADTVWLNIIPVYDTLAVNPHTATAHDSLYLSRDSVAERFNAPEPNLGYSGAQGTHLFPVILIYEDDHLYPMTPKHEPDKTSAYKFSGRSYPAYYTRMETSDK